MAPILNAAPVCRFFLFFNDTATTEIYTLSLHDALPIFSVESAGNAFIICDSFPYTCYPLKLAGEVLGMGPVRVSVSRSRFVARPKKTLSGALEIGLEEAGCD